MMANFFGYVVMVTCFIGISSVICASLPYGIENDSVLIDRDQSIIEEPAIATAVPRDKICKLPIARGHCRALLPRWRYDPKTQKCHEFKFGGCDGNGNNFMTEKDCMQTCQGV